MDTTLIVSLRVLGLPLPIAATYGLENTWGKCGIKFYMYAWWPAVRDSYDSGHSKTNEAFSVLIKGGPR